MDKRNGYKEKRKLKKYRQSIINVSVTALIILLQFSWIAYLLYRATVVNRAANIALSVVGLIIALYMSSRDIRTSHKLSWAFIMLALPIVGIPAYFLFGRPELTTGRRKKMEQVLSATQCFRKQDANVVAQLKEESEDAFLQSQYITNYGGYPLYHADETEYFASGEEMFPQLLADLETAKHFIFLEFFIIGEGEFWESVLAILKEKAAKGVDVRVIYDDFGSAQVLPPHYERVLESMGIHAIRFNPFRPFLSIVMNNRDHRKIVVVDNHISYTGGVNLSDEYINRVERFGYWKDAAVRITGEACSSFTTMFLEMWHYANEKPLESHDVAPFLLEQESQAKRVGYVQPYGDSPLDREYVGEVVYLNMINRAHRYVYMASPYLIISTELATAMVNAAKSGVDVRVIVPEIPDKKLVYQVTKSNFTQLIQGGVKIYTYTPGFIHTKCFVSDDKVATIGSINLDYRSLTLHFECGSFHYNTKAVMQTYEDLTKAIEVSKEIALADCKRKNIISRTVLMIIKLFSPLM